VYNIFRFTIVVEVDADDEETAREVIREVCDSIDGDELHGSGVMTVGEPVLTSRGEDA
jgi:hypothetical protein